MTHWTHIIREIHCHKEEDEEWPEHCKKHDTSAHCQDIHGDSNPGIICEHSLWADVKNDYEYIDGDLLLKENEERKNGIKRN